MEKPLTSSRPLPLGTSRVPTFFSPVYTNALLARDKDTANTTTLDQRLYFTQDANFNVNSAVSTTGTMLQYQVYSPYGEATFTNSSWNTTGSDGYTLEHQFRGMLYDANSGWYVTPNRMYRAQLAFWNRVDPAFADGLNGYAAFAANPINRRDPTGLWTEEDTQHAVTFALFGPLGLMTGCTRSAPAPAHSPTYYGTFAIKLGPVSDSYGTVYPKGYKITYSQDPAYKLQPGHSIVLSQAIAHGGRPHMDVGGDSPLSPFNNPEFYKDHIKDPTMKPPNVWEIKGQKAQPGPDYWYEDSPGDDSSIVVMAIDHVDGPKAPGNEDHVIGSFQFNWDANSGDAEIITATLHQGDSQDFIGADSAGERGSQAFYDWWHGKSH